MIVSYVKLHIKPLVEQQVSFENGSWISPKTFTVKAFKHLSDYPNLEKKVIILVKNSKFTIIIAGIFTSVVILDGEIMAQNSGRMGK